MDIIQTLSGGDRRSIGRSQDVVDFVLNNAHRVGQVIAGLSHDDPIVRMRCADVAEKVSKQHADWLQPFKKTLLRIGASSSQQEVRWHIARMLPRVMLSEREKQAAISLLYEYLEDKSHIVKTFSMTALAELAIDDVDLRKKVIPTLKRLIRVGSPAMQSRGRKLLDRLSNARMTAPSLRK